VVEGRELAGYPYIAFSWTSSPPSCCGDGGGEEERDGLLRR
jgi:hypothetical protein